MPAAVPATVFLDLDGCLVDSLVAVTTNLSAAFRSAGLGPLDEATVRPLIGPPLEATVPALVAARGGEPARTPAMLADYRRRYRETSAALTDVVAGVPDALDGLRAAGWRLALCTSKPMSAASPLVDALGLDRWLDARFAPLPDAGEAEPKTLTLGRGVADVGADVRGAGWMVGDRSYDVAAGRLHGLRTCGVLWGTGDLAELEGAGAEVVVASPDELPGALGTPPG